MLFCFYAPFLNFTAELAFSDQCHGSVVFFLLTLFLLYCFFFVFQIKQRENDTALKYYQKAVKSLDELSWEEKQFALVQGVLAGNVFDWGAKAVSE